jgi:septum formation protein
MHGPKLILASSSPRRRQLLKEAGYEFDVVVPNADVECGLCSDQGPAELVADLACRKAAAVRRQLPRQGDKERGRQGDNTAVIVAADTVAECGGLILGKPQDEEDARRMLQQLRGRQHRVLTGLCVWPLAQSEPLVRVAATTLRMEPLSDAEIDAYLAGGQWVGKAGGFGYQDRLGWIHVEEGSETNVVGLPMELLAEMLAEVGVR